MKRRFLRFSLRALLLLVLLAAIPMAWLAKVQREYEAERRVLDELREHGVLTIGVRHGILLGGPIAGIIRTSPQQPGFLKTPSKWLGMEVMHRAIRADLAWYYGRPVDDEILQRLTQLRKLESIKIVGTHISEEGICELHRELPDCEIDWQPDDGRIKLRR